MFTGERMSKLLLEIYPDPNAGQGGNGPLPAILISPRRPGDPEEDPEAAGGQYVVLRVGDEGCVMQRPSVEGRQTLDMGRWLEAEGWRLRISPAPAFNPAASNAALSVADDPSWAAPEIRIKTYDGEKVKQLRCVLPVDEGSQLIVGRTGGDADLLLEDDHVSRKHIRFFIKDGQRLVEDMGSKWGTRLNNVALTDPKPLKHGDEIRLGKSTINYMCYLDMLPEGGTVNSADLLASGIRPAGPIDASKGPAGRVVEVPPEANKPEGPKKGDPVEVPPPPPEEKKPAPPPPEPIKPKVTKPETPPPKPPEKTQAKPKATPVKPKKRNYWGFDVGGAIIIVLLVLAGIAYLVYSVLFAGKH